MRSISVHQLKAGLDGAEIDATNLVDVREPYEHADGHVPGARLVPLAAVPGLIGELTTERPLYLVCQSGSRSGMAAEYLAQFDIDAVNVEGGTGDWVAAGYPVER